MTGALRSAALRAMIGGVAVCGPLLLSCSGCGPLPQAPTDLSYLVKTPLCAISETWAFGVGDEGELPMISALGEELAVASSDAGEVVVTMHDMDGHATGESYRVSGDARGPLEAASVLLHGDEIVVATTGSNGARVFVFRIDRASGDVTSVSSDARTVAIGRTPSVRLFDGIDGRIAIGISIGGDGELLVGSIAGANMVLHPLAVTTPIAAPEYGTHSSGDVVALFPVNVAGTPSMQLVSLHPESGEVTLLHDTPTSGFVSHISLTMGEDSVGGNWVQHDPSNTEFAWMNVPVAPGMAATDGAESLGEHISDAISLDAGGTPLVLRQVTDVGPEFRIVNRDSAFKPLEGGPSSVSSFGVLDHPGGQVLLWSMRTDTGWQVDAVRLTCEE